MGKSTSIRRSLANEHFLLLKPSSANNAEKVARAMAVYSGVKRVFISSGEYGFVVCANGESCIERIRGKARRFSSGKVKTITNHFVYAAEKTSR